jgi:hypothetical protein
MQLQHMAVGVELKGSNRQPTSHFGAHMALRHVCRRWSAVRVAPSAQVRQPAGAAMRTRVPARQVLVAPLAQAAAQAAIALLALRLRGQQHVGMPAVRGRQFQRGARAPPAGAGRRAGRSAATHAGRAGTGGAGAARICGTAVGKAAAPAAPRLDKLGGEGAQGAGDGAAASASGRHAGAAGAGGGRPRRRGHRRQRRHLHLRQPQHLAPHRRHAGRGVCS